MLEDQEPLTLPFRHTVDTLETIAGLPADKVVEAHGSFAKSHCLDCGGEASESHMLAGARQGQVVRCERKRCSGLVKVRSRPNGARASQS